MMEVIQKAQELGAALADSQELDMLNMAQDALYDDADARLLMNSYQQKQQALQGLQSNGANRDEMAHALTELRGMAEQMQQNNLIATYMKAQQSFNDMMRQVNSILRFCITGETDEECGDCASCSACGGHDHEGHQH